MQDRPKPPSSGLVYGEIVYWGTIIGSVIAIVGTTLSFLSQANVMDPAYLFSAISEGRSTTEIWKEGVGVLPKGHWYLYNLLKGDALTMLGIGIGVFSVIPGMLGSAIVLFKERNHLFGILAIIAGVIILISCLGGLASNN